jgi:transposase
MAKELVTDELWEVVEPLLPEQPPKPKGGRPRIDDRAALTGIVKIALATGPSSWLLGGSARSMDHC